VLRQLRASGRVVLSLTPDANSVDNLPDLPVEDGDRFIVPPKPSSVNVVGAVYEQSSFLFDLQRRVFGYLKQAGGANRDADRSHAFVIRADGSVRLHSLFLEERPDETTGAAPFELMPVSDTLV
jgi:hypothetical protein